MRWWGTGHAPVPHAPSARGAARMRPWALHHVPLLALAGEQQAGQHRADGPAQHLIEIVRVKDGAVRIDGLIICIHVFQQHDQ